MIYKPIYLDLSGEQIKNLKAQNERIFKHLEKRLPLDRQILGGMEAELSNIVNATAELTDLLEKINNSNEHYNIQLLHDDNEILNLPWIMAVDKVSNRPLGNIQQLVLTKCLPAYAKDRKAYPARIAPPLKILVMISSPEDSEHENRLSYEEEEFQILRAFEPLLQTGQVEIDFTEDGSLDALERKIKRNKYHALHYSGHGVYSDGQGYLELEHPLNLKKSLATADMCLQRL